jgi:hypothetical protein
MRASVPRTKWSNTPTHFCFWKKPTMLRSHPHPLPNSKTVALLLPMDCLPAHGNNAALAFGNGHDHAPKVEFLGHRYCHKLH